MPPKTSWIRFGDFLFKYRNKLFPIILLVLFFGFKPYHASPENHDLGVIKDYLAIAITTSGLLFRAAVIGFAYIKRGGLNKKVYAENLVTEGFFGVCRNPLYVGNMLIYIGVFLMHGNPAVVVLGIASYYVMYESIIAAEEYFLRTTFGPAYDAYCADVPRWIPAFSKLTGATEGMRFNFKRVLMKDYPTIASATLALTLLKLLEDSYYDTSAEFTGALIADGRFIAVVLVITLAIAFAKRRRLLKL